MPSAAHSSSRRSTCATGSGTSKARSVNAAEGTWSPYSAMVRRVSAHAWHSSERRPSVVAWTSRLSRVRPRQSRSAGNPARVLPAETETRNSPPADAPGRVHRAVAARRWSSCSRRSIGTVTPGAVSRPSREKVSISTPRDPIDSAPRPAGAPEPKSTHSFTARSCLVPGPAAPGRPRTSSTWRTLIRSHQRRAVPRAPRPPCG